MSSFWWLPGGWGEKNSIGINELRVENKSEHLVRRFLAGAENRRGADEIEFLCRETGPGVAGLRLRLLMGVSDGLLFRRSASGDDLVEWAFRRTGLLDQHFSLQRIQARADIPGLVEEINRPLVLFGYLELE